MARKKVVYSPKKIVHRVAEAALQFGYSAAPRRGGTRPFLVTTAATVPAAGPKASAAAMAEAGLHAFWALADKWNLSASEQNALLKISDSTRLRWRAGRKPDADADLLDRLRLLVLVYQRLNEIAGTEPGAAALLRRPGSAERPADPNASLLDVMCTGSLLDLDHVERMLSAIRVGS